MSFRKDTKTTRTSQATGRHERTPFMAKQRTNLLPFYQGWEQYQKLLIAAIAPLSAEQLALRPAPHLRSIGENVAHIVGTRVGWVDKGRGDGDAEIVLPLETLGVDGAPASRRAERAQR